MGISNGHFNPAEAKTYTNEVAVDSDSIIATKFTPKSTDTEENQPRHTTVPVMQENCLESERDRREQKRSHGQTENNPNPVHPHDTYRPAILLEQFTELFDNEWTRAFQYLTKDDLHQEQTVRTLLNILQEIYTKCQEYIQKQLEDTNDKTSDYLGHFEEETMIKAHIVMAEIETVLTEMENNYKRIAQIKYRKLMDLKTIQALRRQLHVQPESSIHGILENYIQKCIRICWLMCIKCPQMHLDFGVTPTYEDKSDDVNDSPLFFNTAKFVSYTRAGMYLEYVVWPAVYLYKDGPLMKKGVAQGVNIKPELLV
ncbi:hypothetical protein ACJMK2_031856 [Sinanodonta woodiana]|uniref:Mitochondria-eating protein C-terminal domain-containing protein n=1 Tax=Sinanodonta woodiana TaxID=1069815 RepID=A0ABD3X3H0_SINWO